MINKALQFTKNVLDQHLKNRFALDESKVVLNNLIEGNGTLPLINQNKIVLSLINIEKETNKRFYGRNQKLATGNFSDVNPMDRYNLDLLVSSNFDDYGETLSYLNAVILFLQAYNTLDAGLSSAMPAGLGRLEFEIEKISYHDMHSLWTAMGAKYQPSVIYKVRLITMQANETLGFSTGISKIANQLELNAD